MKIFKQTDSNARRQFSILAMTILVLLTGCSSVKERNLSSSKPEDRMFNSPNFRDGTFHNSVASAKSLWSFLKMRVSTSYADWPLWLETKVYPLTEVRHNDASVRLTHINHSTVLIQTQGLNILTDPIYSERCSPVSWAGPKRVRAPGINFDSLPKIDIVLISHDHYDHLDLATIDQLQKRDSPVFLVGLGVRSHFQNKDKVIEMDWWDKQTILGADFHFVPVQHFSGRGLFDRNTTLWGGFVIQTMSKKIYFGGDTGYANHFLQTREKLGPMDIALLPVGAYEPREFMAYAHINPAEAVQAHLDLQAKVSMGIHYGTFQLTAEQIKSPIAELQLALKEKGINQESFITPEFGESILLE